VDGRTGLRACITNYRTTLADIDLIVDRVARAGLVLEREASGRG
jgi:hypothetical protein